MTTRDHIFPLAPEQEALIIDGVTSCEPDAYPIDVAVKAIRRTLDCTLSDAFAVMSDFRERGILETRPQSNIYGRLSETSSLEPPSWKWQRIEEVTE
jgi:hypothetical protein